VRGDHDVNEAKAETRCKRAFPGRVISLVIRLKFAPSGQLLLRPRKAVNDRRHLLSIRRRASDLGDGRERSHISQHFNWVSRVGTSCRPKESRLADIRNAMPRSIAENDGKLVASRASRSATSSSSHDVREALDAKYLDDKGREPSDDHGLRRHGSGESYRRDRIDHDDAAYWPAAIAPYPRHHADKYDGEVKDVSIAYKSFNAGHRHILDDRDPARLQFADADLIASRAYHVGDRG